MLYEIVSISVVSPFRPSDFYVADFPSLW